MSAKKKKPAKKEKPLKKKKSNSIECKKAELKAGRVTSYTPEINPKLDKLVFPYKWQLRARAEILEELIPKKALLDPDSMLDVGDKISGRTLQIISTGAIKTEITHISSKHKGERAVAGNYVHCKVLIPFF